uniref:Kinetochore associated 1 n=1 Tax=Astyanax mexicanus TaxID=7994 RepID=A0A8B9R6W8_ASTMX
WSSFGWPSTRLLLLLLFFFRTFVQSNSRISASNNLNCCLVVADATVVLFDPSFQTVLVHLYFDTVVDAVSVCPQGRFLFVGERNGNLHVIHVPTKKTILTKTLQQPPSNGGQAASYQSLILHESLNSPGMCRNRKFYLNLINPEMRTFIVYRFLCSVSVKIQSRIKMDFSSTKEICKDCSTSAALACFGNEVHLMIGVMFFFLYSVKKIQVVDNLMYILNEENMLSLWDVRSLPNLRKLLVQSLPTMDVLYSLEVSAVSSLVQKTVSTVMFTYQCSPEESAFSLVLRCFTEALPENRLNRLLYKHKFEEAEKFAIAFELDVELVYKVKLDFVLEKLASVAVNGQGQDVWSGLVEEAKTNLMKIMDEQYVLQYCLNAFWPTLGTAEEMLNYAANRFPSSQIQSALAKLATFCILYGSDNFNGVSWIEFLNSTDYLKIIFRLLREGNISRAQYLWLRHEDEFACKFNEKSLQVLLNSIPSDIPSNDLRVWLKGVVFPFMWKVLPKGQRILARWLELRARDLELTEKNGWPQNGLMLAELGLPSVWMSTNLTEDYGTEEVEHLKLLVNNLRQLCDLYSKYNCRLSLSDFEMGSTRSMAFLMLDKVLAPELIPGVVESSVRPYALEHRLDLDHILLDYIKDLLDCCSSQITSLFTEWEDKAVAVLNCMTDTNLVMDAVLEIMYKAVVPWNDTIEKLVQQHLEKEHPKQELLKESYRLMELKKLLRCYGIRNLTLSNSRETMMLVRHILKQDLPTSLEDSLKLAEAYKLRSSEIHYIYCIQLLGNNEREKCIAQLKKLPPAEAELVIERLASWARLKLQDKNHICEELKKLRMQVAQTLAEALKYLQGIQKDDALKRMVCEDKLKMFTAIAHLQEDFDIFLTPEEYDDPAVRHKFNQQLITAYENTRAWRHSGKKHPDKVNIVKADSNVKAAVANDPDGKTKTLSTEAGLHRLARHLQRTEQELWADLAVRALEADTDFVRPLLGPMSTMLQSLQECSQLELALRLLLESYGSILQHFVSNNMDLTLSVKLHSNTRLARDKQTLDAIEKTALSSIRVVVVSLLHKVLNWRVVDCDYAIGLCTILCKSEVLDILWKIITSAWQNYDKIMAVAMVGAHFCSLHNNNEEREKFLAVITDAEWGIKLGKLGVSIQSVFRQCSETKRNLIPVLVKNRRITCVPLPLFCSTYGLDSDSAVSLFITTLLLQEEREDKQGVLGAGDSGLALGDEDTPLAHEDILERALKIVPQLSSTSDLVIRLHTALTKLNPYNYERIERVLKTIQTADESTAVLPLSQMLGLLQHLKSHKRISPPSELENTYLLENSLESTPLANTCLPFHLLLQTNHSFWKIVSPELNEETLPTLLLISKLMKVSLDKLYILTVNHVFKHDLMPLLLDQTKRTQGHGPKRDTATVIQNIFKHTVCIQNLELAAATIYKIAQDVPSGHYLSPALSEELKTRGEMLTSKLQLQYQRSATENALISFQLDCPELLKLTGLPGRLIVALFEHNSVVERMKGPAGQIYPDIHTVAKEIATINGVDLLKIRNILLDKWLCKTEQPNDQDVHYQEQITDVTDDPDLMRVVYLLQMHPMDMSARLLSPVLTAEIWPLGGSGLRLTFEHRSRALLCLIHIADSATLETLSHTPRDKVKYSLCKKVVVLNFLRCTCISYLQKILETLRGVPSLLEVASFSRTWRSVILAPFMTASLPLSPHQQAIFYRTFALLLK